MDKELDLAKVIKFHRKKSGLSRNELSRISGVGKSTLFDIEKGKLAVQLDTLLKILTVLNMKIQFVSPLMIEFEKSKTAEIDHEKS
jgi:transcriptional regulator with XRE-family HTH domain